MLVLELLAFNLFAIISSPELFEKENALSSPPPPQLNQFPTKQMMVNKQIKMDLLQNVCLPWISQFMYTLVFIAGNDDSGHNYNDKHKIVSLNFPIF